ncbi:hypothetical protein ACJX0J_034537, partial [Zea mays]
QSQISISKSSMHLHIGDLRDLEVDTKHYNHQSEVIFIPDSSTERQSEIVECFRRLKVVITDHLDFDGRIGHTAAETMQAKLPSFMRSDAVTGIIGALWDLIFKRMEYSDLNSKFTNKLLIAMDNISHGGLTEQEKGWHFLFPTMANLFAA